MKKPFLLIILLVTIFTAHVNAQQNNDAAAMMQRMKDRIKPQLIEKVKLTDEEANKVLDINWEVRMKMREMQDLSADEHHKKAEELDAMRDKKYKAIPLSDAQVKAVNTFFEELHKQMMEHRKALNGQR